MLRKRQRWSRFVSSVAVLSLIGSGSASSRSADDALEELRFETAVNQETTRTPAPVRLSPAASVTELLAWGERHNWPEVGLLSSDPWYALDAGEAAWRELVTLREREIIDAIRGRVTTFAELAERPLRLPAVPLGARCPRTAEQRQPPHTAPAWGPGPVYPVFGGNVILSYVRGKPDGEYARGSGFRGTHWGGNKVLWVSEPDYLGPALIRGRQLDGPDEVRFDGEADPPRALLFPEGATGVVSSGTSEGWRDRPSYVRVRRPGCYAFQIDGHGFSEVVVFEAIPLTS